jgi:hypothetical protein
MKTSARICASLLTLLIASHADAARRGLRIDFGTWSDELAIGSDDCPGTTEGGGVTWKGIRFHGGPADIFDEDDYCQTVPTFENGLGEFDYLNEIIIDFDEAELARKIGTNATPPFIIGIRYTFIDGDRNDLHAEGFQWVFYEFPGGITLVAFYIRGTLREGRMDPKISQGENTLWHWVDDGFDGEYFCFDGTTYIGTWDDSTPLLAGPVDPADGCRLPPLEEMYSNGFEQSEGD